MQILFVHQNFPAQFGHVAEYLAAKHGCECVFATKRLVPKPPKGVRVINYPNPRTAPKGTHPANTSHENAMWHAWTVKQMLERHPEVRPDLIVGHSGFGSTLFLAELFRGTPLLNYFEYFYHPHNSDIDFRPDFPAAPEAAYRSRGRNATLLLDLHTCTRGQCPTRFQHSTLPREYQEKVEVIFDGIDPNLWQPCAPADRKIGDWVVPKGVKLVTYATRGMESMRGFDVFVNVAHRLSKERSDVVFAIAGQDRIAYGGDTRHTGGKSLKQYLFETVNPDRSRFKFLGLLPQADLAKLLSLSDLHFYLTVPFVLSWSLFNALACGATVLASDTAPVREVVTHEKTGLLVPFFDEDGFLALARRVLADPTAFRHLGRAGRELVVRNYSYEVCLPRIVQLYSRTAGRSFPPAHM